MVNIKVKYCYDEDELNEVLKEFDPKGQQLPILGKITYVEVNYQLVAVVEYVDGDEPIVQPARPGMVPPQGV